VLKQAATEEFAAWMKTRVTGDVPNFRAAPIQPALGQPLRIELNRQFLTLGDIACQSGSPGCEESKVGHHLNLANRS